MDEWLFYGGLIVLAAALIGLLVYFLLSRIRKGKLTNQLTLE